MITLKIKEKKEHGEYILQEVEGEKCHSLILEFYDTPQPNVGDALLIHENLLNVYSKEYSQPYAFAPLNVEDESKDVEDSELACLKSNGKEIVLKRIYG